MEEPLASNGHHFDALGPPQTFGGADLNCRASPRRIQVQQEIPNGALQKVKRKASLHVVHRFAMQGQNAKQECDDESLNHKPYLEDLGNNCTFVVGSCLSDPSRAEGNGINATTKRAKRCGNLWPVPTYS